LRKALVEAVTPEDITAIVHALLLKAKQGKRGAGKLLLVRAGLEAMDQLAPGPKEEKEPAASKAPSTNGLESALPSTNG
jgi:hypothetical protein